jgi:hypothetical protein
MPRGFKRDEDATLAARFEDYRSFVSQPKAINGECDVPRPHVVLYGRADKARVRKIIFEKNRQENGGINRCWNCRKLVLEKAHEMFAAHFCGEWDHIRNKPGERCDCPDNGRVACPTCHRQRHVRPRWTVDEVKAKA